LGLKASLWIFGLSLEEGGGLEAAIFIILSSSPLLGFLRQVLFDLLLPFL
jgi:hypothetical protein